MSFVFYLEPGMSLSLWFQSQEKQGLKKKKKTTTDYHVLSHTTLYLILTTTFKGGKRDLMIFVK